MERDGLHVSVDHIDLGLAALKSRSAAERGKSVRRHQLRDRALPPEPGQSAVTAKLDAEPG